MSTISPEQALAFVEVIRGLGAPAEMIRAVGRGDWDENTLGSVTVLMEMLSERHLIHGRWLPAEDVAFMLDRRLAAKLSGEQRGRIRDVGLIDPPDDTDDPDVVLVQYVTLGTPRQTLEFWYQWFINVLTREQAHLQSSVRDLSRIFLAETSSGFEPWTRRWVRLDLSVTTSTSWRDVFASFSPPAGLEAIAALVLQQWIIDAVAGQRMRGLVIAGMEHDDGWHRGPIGLHCSCYTEFGISSMDLTRPIPEGRRVITILE